MTSFADILLLALALVAPKDGATVPTLREDQKAFIGAKRADRVRVMTNAGLRRTLAARGGAQQPLRLEWTGETNAVYDLTVVRDGGARQTFSIPGRTWAYVTNLELGAKYLWSVALAGSAEEASATFVTEAAAPRLLCAGGVLNLRDLGGWKGLGGRKVRQGMVYRSAGLRSSARRKGGALFGGSFEPGDQRVTEAGIAELRDDLGVRTDLELRTNQEAACMTSSALGDDVAWVHVPFAAYDFIDNPVRGREPFVTIFRTFLERKNYPILFHCSGGRDRTGTLAFILNGLLGVDGDDLCRDWEATVFCEESMKFGPTRLDRLLRYLRGLGGDSVAEQCRRYALSCGVTEAEINTFREIMLEGGN